MYRATVNRVMGTFNNEDAAVFRRHDKEILPGDPGDGRLR